jgi:hypothetical protein
MRPLLLMLLLLAGCARLEYDDVTFESARVVDYWREPEAARVSASGTAFPPEAALKVRLRTSANLFVVPPNADGLMPRTIICDAPDRGNINLSFVFARGYPAPPRYFWSDPAMDAEIARIAATGPTAYDVFIRLRRVEPEAAVRYGDPPLPPYDLAATPADVCLRLVRYDGSYGSYYSNMVRIPAAAIAAAVQSAGWPP